MKDGNILIFGAAGQLGVDCAAVLQTRYNLTLLDLPAVDVSDAAQCSNAMDRCQPAVIINCAAYTNVDGAESEPEKAWSVNAGAPASMAAWVEQNKAWLIHISTDFVFDGDKPPDQSYIEDDIPHPISVYGETKLAGEQEIVKATDRYSILRTAWLYGHAGRNFPKTMLRLALTSPGREIKVVNDQYGSPTWAHRLARQINAVVDAKSQGIFHSSAEGQCTWYEFANEFLKAMSVPHHLRPCSSAEYLTPARRPHNSTLENQRLKKAGLQLMTDWRSDMLYFVSRYREKLLEEIVL